jgi:hypothetical protein
MERQKPNTEETVFEQNLRVLREIFPEVDAEHIFNKLVDNHSNLEAAINAIMK